MKFRKFISFILCLLMVSSTLPLTPALSVSAESTGVVTGNIPGGGYVYTLDTDGVESGSRYLIVASDMSRALQGITSRNTRVPSVDVNITNNGQTIITDNTNNEYEIVANNGAYVIKKQNIYLQHYWHVLNTVTNINDATSQWTIGDGANGFYSFSNSDSNGTWYLRYDDTYENSQNSAHIKRTFMVFNEASDRVRLYKYTGPNNGATVEFSLDPSEITIKKWLSATITPTVKLDGKEVAFEDCTFTFTSENREIASVYRNFVRGMLKGSTTITVTLTAVEGKTLVSPLSIQIPVTVEPNTVYFDHDVLFSYLKGEADKLPSPDSSKQQLYNKIQEAAQITKEGYSDETFVELMRALQTAIDSYTYDTDPAMWLRAINKIQQDKINNPIKGMNLNSMKIVMSN